MTLARRDLTNRLGLFHFLVILMPALRTDAGLLLRLQHLSPPDECHHCRGNRPQSLRHSEIESVLTGGAPEPPGSLTCFLLLTS
jgi:hypothetical protein